MITKRGIIRKTLASISLSIILSFVLIHTHGYAPYSVYFLYIAAGSLFVGIPCSMIADIIMSKVRLGTILSLIIGLTLHLIFAAVFVYFFAFADFNNPDTYADVLGYSVFAASAGLWMIDAFFKKIGL